MGASKLERLLFKIRDQSKTMDKPFSVDIFDRAHKALVHGRLDVQVTALMDCYHLLECWIKHREELGFKGDATLIIECQVFLTECVKNRMEVSE